MYVVDVVVALFINLLLRLIQISVLPHGLTTSIICNKEGRWITLDIVSIF